VKQVVIVGGGPAGLMLAYQLVSNNIPARVIERHSDFARTFRGEYVQSSVFAALDQLGIMRALIDNKLALPDIERRMFVGWTRQVKLPGGKEPGMVMPQESFLQLLHEACSRYPHYRMDFRTTALDFDHGGIDVRRDGNEERIDANLIVVCNGRNSALRKTAGLPLESYTMPADTLWMRFDFSDAPELLPTSLDVHMHGKGVVAVFHPTTNHRLQYAYSAPGDLSTLKKNLPELRKAVLAFVPERLRAAVDKKLDEHTETQVLRVTVDRLKKWHANGLLFLGDAAHTMSPSGGQGLNAAIRDAIVAANHLIAADRKGNMADDAVLAAIEAERLPEIEMLQAGQVRAHGMVLKPLGVLHVMFTMLKLFLPMIDKKAARATASLQPVIPEFAVKL
jgi:2-polyprenyl-6-methoxyphenol hydroxylase-like FAD-dependent oxidoreductase